MAHLVVAWLESALRAVMGARRTVLVVEDHPDARALVRTYLLAMGVDVVDVAEGRSAIGILKSSTPDLVCLDLMLPELSGFEVCEYMRSQPALRGVPILVMSARAKPMDRAFAEELGATAYLIKPFKRKEFCRAVDICLKPLEVVEGGAP
jgi:two-component system OmpR family response regulator